MSHLTDNLWEATSSGRVVLVSYPNTGFLHPRPGCSLQPSSGLLGTLSFCFVLRFIFVCFDSIDVYMWTMCVLVPLKARGGSSDPLQLEIGTIMSHQLGAGTEPGSSRSASALNF